MRVTAGIAEATALRGKDEVIREADLALIGAKRIHQDVAVYGPDMALVAGRAHVRARAPRAHAGKRPRAGRRRQGLLHPQPLPDRLAAVRGRSPTRSALDGDQLGRIRLAGLLHDVGKIGVPDAILNKPAPLTDDE